MCTNLVDYDSLNDETESGRNSYCSDGSINDNRMVLSDNEHMRGPQQTNVTDSRHVHVGNQYQFNGPVTIIPNNIPITDGNKKGIDNL